MTAFNSIPAPWFRFAQPNAAALIDRQNVLALLLQDPVHLSALVHDSALAAELGKLIEAEGGFQASKLSPKVLDELMIQLAERPAQAVDADASYGESVGLGERNSPPMRTHHAGQTSIPFPPVAPFEPIVIDALFSKKEAEPALEVIAPIPVAAAPRVDVMNHPLAACALLGLTLMSVFAVIAAVA
jgi:hypothetical protein